MAKMNYKKIKRIAEELEDQLDITDDQVKETPAEAEETLVEAEEVAPTDNEVTASNELKKLAQVLYNKKQPLTASQKRQLKAKLVSIASSLKQAEGEEGEEDEIKKTDLVKSIGQGFTKNGPLRQKIKWDELKGKGITPMTKLMDLQLDDLRLILTKVRGIAGV